MKELGSRVAGIVIRPAASVGLTYLLLWPILWGVKTATGIALPHWPCFVSVYFSLILMNLWTKKSQEGDK